MSVPKNYYVHDTNTDSDCDYTTGPYDLVRDTAETSGSITSPGTSSASYVDVASWDVDVFGKGSGLRVSPSYSIDVAGPFHTESDCRFRLEAVNDACAVLATSDYTTVMLPNDGIATGTFTISWPDVNATRLRLVMQVRKLSGSGAKSCKVNLPSSFITCEFLSRREMIVLDAVTRLQGIPGVESAAVTRTLDNPSDIRYTPAFRVWGGDETKEHRTGSHRAGSKTNTLAVAVRCYVKGNDAAQMIEQVMSDAEAYLEAEPAHLGRGWIFAWQVTNSTYGVSSEGLTEPWGVGDLILTCEYNQIMGNP